MPDLDGEADCKYFEQVAIEDRQHDSTEDAKLEKEVIYEGFTYKKPEQSLRNEDVKNSITQANSHTN